MYILSLSIYIIYYIQIKPLDSWMCPDRGRENGVTHMIDYLPPPVGPAFHFFFGLSLHSLPSFSTPPLPISVLRVTFSQLGVRSASVLGRPLGISGFLPFLPRTSQREVEQPHSLSHMYVLSWSLWGLPFLGIGVAPRYKPKFGQPLGAFLSSQTEGVDR